MAHFPADIESMSEAFVMIPVGYSADAHGTAVKEIPNIKGRITLPTPSGGLNLSEGGNWDETAGYQNMVGGLSAIGATKVLDAMGPAGKQAVAKGQFVNDYAALSYSGSNFRSYTFSWDLYPDNEHDANALYSIIKTVRKAALPSYGGNMVTYPSMWIVFPVTKNTIGMYLQHCVISDVTINYTPEGNLKTFKSGHPLHTNVSITFKELFRASRADV
jgi:hypothetical protein